MTQSNGVFEAASTDTGLPFSVNETMIPPCSADVSWMRPGDFVFGNAAPALRQA
jgi:hypothetical protein